MITAKLDTFEIADRSFDADEYLIENAGAGMFLACEPDIEVQTWQNPKMPRLEGDCSEKRLLIIRPGGFGDILFLTPIIKHLIEYKFVKDVTVATLYSYQDILKHQPYPCGVLDYPIKTSELDQFDVIVSLENLIELRIDGKEMHAIDLFARAIGVTLDDDAKEMIYQTDPKTDEQMSARFPKTGKKRIGVQVKASAKCRTYPLEKTGEVTRLLLREGYEVFYFGEPGNWSAPPVPGLTVLPNERPPLSMNDSVSLLKTCDAVIAPDSSICHLAGALGIPTIALYGPFPWQIRTAYAPSIRAINGHANCAPCYHHNRNGAFPKGMPCVAAQKCVALDSIPPDRIISLVKKALR